MNRYFNNTFKIKEEIKKIGNIKLATFTYSQYSSRYDDFKKGNILPTFDKNCAGGALMDLNVYNINFALMMFGEPKGIHYYANIENEIDTSGILVMEYDGFKCLCIAAKDSIAPLYSSIQADEGTIVIPSTTSLVESYYRVSVKETSRLSDDNYERLNYNEGFYMYPELVDIIKTKKIRAKLDLTKWQICLYK